QPVRHTDARRFAQSGAGEDDRPVTRKLAEAFRNLVRWNPERTLDRLAVVEAAHVDEDGSALDELPRPLRLDAQRRAAKRRGDVVAAGRLRHRRTVFERALGVDRFGSARQQASRPAKALRAVPDVLAVRARIGPGPAVDSVEVGAAVDRVVPVLAEERVVAGEAVDDVGPAAGVHDV